jgi:phospholipase D-like protein
MARVRPGSVVDVIRRPILRQVRSAESELVIAAPFISAGVAAEISRASLAAQAKKRMLLTALNDDAVARGYLDPTGLRLLAESGFEIRSIRNLHAKFVLVDRDWGVVGSGNLTSRGLAGKRRRNLELGVVLTPSQVAATRTIAMRWWKAGGEVDGKSLDKSERLAASTSRSSQRLRGGIGPFVDGEDEDEVIPDLGRRDKQGKRKRTGLWLKMLYHHTRRDTPNWWRDVEWVSDGRPPPSPTRLVGGPRYEIGDLLVFYLLEKGGPVRCCPAVAEVQSEPMHNPDFVAEHGASGDELKWPWVTQVEVLDSTSLQDAPTLDDLGVAPQSVRQQGRIVLEAGQFEAARAGIEAGS